MKEFFLLKFLDRFRLLFEKSRIDYPVMRRILQIKLTLDDRRVPTIMMSNRSQRAEGTGSFRTGLLLYGIMGVFIAVILFFPFPLFYKMNLVFGMTLFLVMTTMISDFSTVLLDIRDKNIILPRPVTPQTLNAAKLFHILSYLFRITLAIAGPSLAAGTIVYGVGFLVLFLVELLLVCGFVIFLQVSCIRSF